MEYSELEKLTNKKPETVNFWKPTWRFHDGKIYKLEELKPKGLEFKKELSEKKQDLKLSDEIIKDDPRQEKFDLKEDLVKENIKEEKLVAKHKCKECGFVSNDMKEMYKHCLSHLKIEKKKEGVQKKEIKEIDNNNRFAFKCTDCGLLFPAKRSLAAHKRWKHAIVEDR